MAASADELIEGATSRRPLHSTDSLSGASLEGVVIGGERFVLKHLRRSEDFVARATAVFRMARRFSEVAVDIPR